MKTYHNSPLLYEEGFSIIINEISTPIENSTFYYFDYDKRSHSINMDFPHFHSFYELMILLSPKAYHFVEGKRYDLIANDMVLLSHLFFTSQNTCRDLPVTGSSSILCFPRISISVPPATRRFFLFSTARCLCSAFTGKNRAVCIRS